MSLVGMTIAVLAAALSAVPGVQRRGWGVALIIIAAFGFVLCLMAGLS